MKTEFQLIQNERRWKKKKVIIGLECAARADPSLSDGFLCMPLTPIGDGQEKGSPTPNRKEKRKTAEDIPRPEFQYLSHL
ncbi:hypothetical protein OUZ56_015002 [Daphnia magna]|uniref:Uncharacterized protein n=1 Tax=Daphnia magna TaxID=35525 RepID=A0ABR0ALI9_9CRUS|nr:hypothetical protein OUZ56_015002 [Daphnia magna]